MKQQIQELIKESFQVKELLFEDENALLNIEKSINLIVEAFKKRKKILIFGNGGSAGDAQHFAGEIVNRFKIERRPMPAVALTTDTSVLTAIANDLGYDYVFSKQIEALGEKGDIAIAITTSDIEEKKGGHSANIANALVSAKRKGLQTIGLVSIKSKEILRLLDTVIKIPSTDTSRIQESHIMVIHIICEIVEKEIFAKKI
jgi:D-sedoheptulose 7-phosphate isomerase